MSEPLDVFARRLASHVIRQPSRRERAVDGVYLDDPDEQLLPCRTGSASASEGGRFGRQRRPKASP